MILSPTTIGCIVFACVFGGALLGLFLAEVLPEQHLSLDTKDAVKLGMGVIGTMAALVLGLLIASAKSHYDAEISAVTQMAAKFSLLDRVLAHYGPETTEARDLLRGSVAGILDRMWPKDNQRFATLAPSGRGEEFFDKIEELVPRTDSQHSLRDRALEISTEIGYTHWLLFEQADASIPMPFLVVLIFWLTIIFASFSLFAPRNATVIATQFVCALSVSAAIVLILELERPFAGLLQISSAPLQTALAHMGQ